MHGGKLAPSRNANISSPLVRRSIIARLAYTVDYSVSGWTFVVYRNQQLSTFHATTLLSDKPPAKFGATLDVACLTTRYASHSCSQHTAK